MNLVMFYLFAAIIVIFSILTVTSRRILRAAVYLLTVLISTSGLYFLLDYKFLAAVQLTLYVGGIVVLIIFSILLTSHISEKFDLLEKRKTIFSGLATILGAALTISVLATYQFKETVVDSSETVVSEVGKSLMSFGENGYVLPFEVISILLLASMIGAIVIAKK